MIQRDILAQITPWLGKEKILILKGSRQVGKTTLLKQIEAIIKEKDPQAQVVYLLADNLDLQSLFQSPAHLTLYLQQLYQFPQQFIYLIIDEFQVIEQAGLFIKNLFDSYKGKFQLIASGSSSLEITKNSEFLTGRALEFNVDRISFAEYLRYSHQLETPHFTFKDWSKIDLWYQTFGSKLFLAMTEYLTYGGYPEVVTTMNIEQKKILLNAILSTYIEKDIIHFLRIENVLGFNNLLKLLASQIGNLVNISEISNTLGLAINTVKKYLDILQGTYVIDFVKPFSRNVRVEISKMPKIYLLDPGLRNYLMHSWGEDSIRSGPAIENFTYLTLLGRFSSEQIHFYRTISGAEIDFVLEHEDEKLSLCEVKYRSKVGGTTAAMKNMEERYKGSVKEKIIVTKQTFLRHGNTVYLPAVMLPFVRW